MSKETEKAINGLHKFIESHGGAESEEELRELIDQFMKEYNASVRMQPELNERTAETSDDWLELAENAHTLSDALRYADKAIALNPDNLDAKVFKALAENEMPHDQLEAIGAIIEQATERMKELRFIPDDVGEFWLVHGTRPYMRALQTKFDFEKTCGMYLHAIKDGEEILRLNKNDNMGVRSSLMALYVLLLKEAEAEALINQFSQDGYIESNLALFLSILYFRLGKRDRAKAVLLQLSVSNRDTKKFIHSILKGDMDKHISHMSDIGYRPNTIEEFIVTFDDNPELFTASGAYFIWADDVLKHQKPRKIKTKKKNKVH